MPPGPEDDETVARGEMQDPRFESERKKERKGWRLDGDLIEGVG